MNEVELNLWQRYKRRDKMAQNDLVLWYLPLVDLHARRIAAITGTGVEDLRQNGVIGLIRAIERFDPGKGAPFSAFARQYIRGAIFDSSEVTRNIARRQGEIYRKVILTEGELVQQLGRNPTIEEVAERAELTPDQIRNAIDARGVAFAEVLPEGEELLEGYAAESPQPERRLYILEALDRLDERERDIITRYYWQGELDKEIALILGLSMNNVAKIRQRALAKLRQLLAVTGKDKYREI